MAIPSGKKTEQRILRLYQQGWQQIEIAAKVHLSVTEVRLLLIANRKVPSSRKLSKRAQQRILQLRRQKMSCMNIAEAVGVSSSSVRTVLLGAGQSTRLDNRKPLTPVKIKAVREMHQMGLSLRDIGAVIGYSYETVRTVLNRRGPPARRGRPRKKR